MWSELVLMSLATTCNFLAIFSMRKKGKENTNEAIKLIIVSTALIIFLIAGDIYLRLKLSDLNKVLTLP